MEDKTYSITLADGTVLENLRLNGNNYISQTPVDPALFDGNCSPVIISNEEEEEETHKNMELVQVTLHQGEYWFVLRDFSPAELASMKMQSDIEYIAMMSGIEL